MHTGPEIWGNVALLWAKLMGNKVNGHFNERTTWAVRCYFSKFQWKISTSLIFALPLQTYFRLNMWLSSVGRGHLQQRIDCSNIVHTYVRTYAHAYSYTITGHSMHRWSIAAQSETIRAKFSIESHHHFVWGCRGKAQLDSRKQEYIKESKSATPITHPLAGMRFQKSDLWPLHDPISDHRLTVIVIELLDQTTTPP